MAPVQEADLEGQTAAPQPVANNVLNGAMETGASNSKLKTRAKLLRGLSRISSSPSLAQLGRPRSASSPYSTSGSFSCVSLASNVSPSPMSGASFSPLPSPGAEPSTASTTPQTTPTAEHQYFVGIDSRLSIRKIENEGLPCLSPASPTSPLPPELVAKLEGPTARGRSGSSVARKKAFNLWANIPHEIKVHIFSYLHPKELVRISRVSKSFYTMSLDGQLWTRFDASEFYREIPAESMAMIIHAAGPFIKDLNLRGCVQVEHYKRAEVVVKACRNLINATFEGCRNFHRTTLHLLLRSNERLESLNLTGLTAVTNTTCKIIAESCPQLEVFNVSWCKQMDARGIKLIVEGCPRLKDLRAGEIRGFDNMSVAQVLFKTNRLERLVLSGCAELTDQALMAMIHGTDPEMDILTDRPIVPPRRLRHLDLSRCARLTSQGVQSLGHFIPDMEGLQLSGCTALTDTALEPILCSTPRLTHLELEDLSELTNNLLAEHLAKAPCAKGLEHLSVSYCENLGDMGILPVVKSCTRLKKLDLDNTRISDLVLAEAASMVGHRSERTTDITRRPKVGLQMVVYDCQNVTWTGIREVLFRNAQIKLGSGLSKPSTYPAEVIGIKCFYGYQMTVDEHMKRVLRSDFESAGRLERKWADYMQANEEAGVTGSGGRRRRRRAREAQMLHADEEEGGAGGPNGRRRARTVAACVVM